MNKFSCFLSSTFNDMQSERDFFRLSLEEKINENLKDTGLFLEFVDLRWGVNVQTDDESDYDKKVLSVCLNEIKNTNPFFIVFLGERYGWIPGQEDVLSVVYENGGDKENFTEKSITEMEINYALSTYLDTRKCLFYFRNPVDFGDDEEAREKYVSKGDDLKKLNQLKQKILSSFPNQVRRYNATWDNENASFVLDNSFKENVFEDIKALFQNEYEALRLESDYQKRNRLLRLEIDKNAALFAGRKQELSQAFEFLREEEKKILDVVSEEGGGKTFFASKLAQEILLKNDCVFLPYICDNTDEVLSVRGLLTYYLQQLGCLDDVSEITLEELIKKFQKTVNVVAYEKKVVVLIDGLDRIVTDKKELALLNMFAYNNVQFIITRNQNYSMAKYIAAMDSEELKILQYSSTDIQEIVKKFFDSSHRTVGDGLIQAVLAKEQRNPKTCSNPSYLTLLLHALDNLSEKDFKVINQCTALNDLSFAQNVELFQKEIVDKSGKTFEEELYKQRERIEGILPIAKYYFEYLTVSPHGMSEREMYFILEQFSLQQTPTDFAWFIKQFKCFLSRDEKGYWRFSQKSVTHCFAKKLDEEQRKVYNQILLRLYHQEDKTSLKNQYALGCYFALKDYQCAYDFIVNNGKKKSVLKAFAKHVNESPNYLQDMKQLWALDGSNQLFSKAIILLKNYEVSFDKWCRIIYKKYALKKWKAILSDKKERAMAYSSLVSLAHLANDKGEYRKGLSILSLLNKHFKNYAGTKLYPAYEMKALGFIFKCKLGRMVSYSALISATLDEIFEVESKQEQIEEKWPEERKRLSKVLSVIDKCHEATEDTGEHDRFDLSFVDDCIELGYFEGEEYIYWVSKKFAYLARKNSLTPKELQNSRIYQKWLQKQDESVSNVLKEMEKQEAALLNKQYKDITDYIKDPNSNQELVAMCCMNLSKYHDNFAVADDTTFTNLAVEKTKAKLERNFSDYSIKNYHAALTQKVAEDEMFGRLKKEDVEELLRVSKLAIMIEPTTTNYNVYFETYEKCEKMSALPKAEPQEKEKYIEKRKKEVKFEVSEELHTERKNKLMYGAIFGIIIAISLLFCGVLIFRFFRNLHLWGQILIILVSVAVAGSLGGTGINLLLEDRTIKRTIYGILLLVLTVGISILLLGYSISDEALLDIVKGSGRTGGSMVQFYGHMRDRGGREVLEFCMKLFLLLLPLIIALTMGMKYLKYGRIWRSSSCLKNYKTYVVKYPARKKILIVSNVIMAILEIFVVAFLVDQWFRVRNLDFVQMYHLEKAMMLVIILIFVFCVVTFLVCFYSSKKTLKELEGWKQQYDKSIKIFN